jgi:murein DD-endopeptidase MepM/ murein hydrolase activator NlpD
MPVYAMADGWVLRCHRTIDDNQAGRQGHRGRKHVSHRVHANGEVALYAHFRKGSVPAELCPTEGKDFSQRAAPKVRAGQFLGRVGNSGHSSGPHLHVNIATTGQKGEQGVPLLFRNVRTRFAGET